VATAAQKQEKNTSLLRVICYSLQKKRARQGRKNVGQRRSALTLISLRESQLQINASSQPKQTRRRQTIVFRPGKEEKLVLMKRGKRGRKKKRSGTTPSPVTADSTYTPIRRGNVLKRAEKAENSEKLTSAALNCSSKCFHKPVSCSSKSGNWAHGVQRSATRSGWSENKAKGLNKGGFVKTWLMRVLYGKKTRTTGRYR
ncbi:uncharacterized, partial [Tachysurus ichikawai]